MHRHRIGWLLTASLIGATVVALGAQVQAPTPLRPFSQEEKRAIVDKMLGADRIQGIVKEQRLRALSVVPQQVEKNGVPTVVAAAVLVNYTTGEGLRITVDPSNGQVQAVEAMKGRPQSSAEERQEGRELVRTAGDLAPLMTAKTRIEGGFVVDAPKDQSAQGRYLEFHVLTPDGSAFAAEVIVDLARNQVVTIRRQPSAEKRGAA